MYSKMRCIKQTTKFYNDPFLSFFTWPSVQGYASLPSFESYEEFPVPLWCYNSVHSLVLVSLRLCPQGRLFARRQRVAHWSVAWLQGCSTWHRAQPIGKRVDLGRIGSLGTTGSPSASGMWTAPDGPPALCPPPPPPRCADEWPTSPTQRVLWLPVCAWSVSAMRMPPPTPSPGALRQFAACAQRHQHFPCAISTTWGVGVPWSVSPCGNSHRLANGVRATGTKYFVQI